MTTIDPPPIISDDEQDPIGAWKPSENFQSAFDDSSIGQAGNRIAAVMGSERYMQARTLRGMLELGVPEAALGEEQKTLLREYSQNYVDDAARELAASIYAADAEKNQTVAGAAIDLTAEFADNALSTIPQLVYGVASLFSGEAPRSMNEAIGLDGIQAPRVGYYLGALAEKLGGSETPLDDEYRKIARGEEMRQEQRDLLPRLAFGGTAAAGSLHGLLGRGALAPLSRLAGAAEKVTRLERGAAAVGKWAAEQSGAKWLAGLAAKELLVPGLRFGLWEGVANYVDPETGQPMDGMGRLKHAIAGIAWSPVYSAFGALGGAAANRLTGSAGVVRAAHAQWLHNLPEESKAAIARAGEAGFSKAWDTFVLAGMPGVAIPLQKRMVAEVAQSAIEAAGFAITDLAFWSTIIDAFQGEPGAVVKATEMFATNMFTNSMLRFGGSHRALAARQHERLLADLQAALAGDAAKAQRAPAEIPEAPVAEPKPEAKPAEPEPQPQPEAKPAERRVEIPEDPAVTERVEAERLLEFVEARANRLGVAEALTKKGNPERQLWVAYAARIRHWLEGGREGLRPEFPGQQKPADLVAFEKDIADRRSRAAEYRAKAARGEVEPKQPEAKEPSTRAAEADWDAEQLRGQQQTAEAQKQRAGVDEAVRYHRNAEIAEAKLALDGIGGPTAEEDIRVVSPKKGKPKLVTYRDGKYWQRDIYGKTEWSELPAKQALALRGKDVREPIKEQLEIVDQIAKRIFELGDEITPEQLRMLSAAANLAASIDRFKDPSINAALSLAEQVLPTAWEPRHLDLWAQMALRGMSPEAQQAVLEQFAVTPAAPPEKAKQRQQARAKKAAAASQQPSTAHAQPVAAKTAATEGKGSTAPRSVAAGEEIVRDPQNPISALPDPELRSLAETAGLDPNLPRADLINQLGAESGAIHARALLGLGAMVAVPPLIYSLGPTVAPYVGAGAIALAAMPWLYHNLAKPAYERLRTLGNKALAETIIPHFRRVADRIQSYQGKIDPLVDAVRTITNESGKKAKRAYREATRFLQRVTWKGDGPNSYGVSEALRILDGWIRLPENASPELREIVDRVREVMHQGGDMGVQLGVMMLEKATGKSFPVKFSRDRWVLPRVMTGDGMDILFDVGSDAWNVLRDGIADLNGFTIEDASAKMKMLASLPSYKRVAMEFTREIPRMPDYLRVGGRNLAILETRPFEFVAAYASRTARRLAHTEVWGQEAFDQKGSTLDAAGESIGLKLTPNATQEQIEARAQLKEFVENSPNRDDALRGVVEAMRLQAGLPTTNRKGILGFDVAREGRVRHLMRAGVLPLRALDVSLKLVEAATVNVAEPLVGAPAALLGDMGSVTSKVYLDALFNRKALARDHARYRAIGGIVSDQQLRWGGFSRQARPGHRANDIARQAALPAWINSRANHFGDLAVARRAEGILAELKSGKGAKHDYLLDHLDFTAAEKAEFQNGTFTAELGHTFMRRVREKTLFVRGPETAGAMSGDRVFRFLFPFTQWASGNLRYNARVLRDFSKVFTDRNLTPQQRTARVKTMLRWGLSKGGTAAVAALSRAAWNYLWEIGSAFEGADDEQTTKNFLSDVAEAAALTDLGLPVLNVAAMDALHKLPGGKSAFDALATSTWPLDVAIDAIQFFGNTGVFKNEDPSLMGVPSKLWKAVEERAPFIKDIVAWTGDPQLDAAVRRRFEVLPPEQHGGADEFDAFRNSMARAVKKIRDAGGKVDTANRETVRELIRKAAASSTQKKADHSITGKEFQAKRPREQKEAGWDSAIASLRFRRMVAGLKQSEQDHVRQQIGDDLYQRLEEFDQTIDGLIRWAESEKRRAR